MNRILFCSIVFNILLTGAVSAADARSTEANVAQPNFLFIYMDDMRWDAMSIVQEEQGETGRFPWFKTPNLDQLAAEGLRFRNAFAATAVCSASRAEFLTGRYGHFNGVANNQTHFPVDNATWATGLKEVGYTTAYIGKWHMSNQRERPGFDYAASFTSHGRYNNCPFLIDGVETKTNGWIDDVSTDYAIEYLKRDFDRPFAMALGFKTPHIPFEPPVRAKDRYAGEKVRAVANFDKAAIYRPETEYGNPWEPRAEQPGWALSYFRCISAIDENIGRLMAALDEQGLTENTVVIFSSDNGYYFGEHGLGDYQGDKRSAYEEAMRIPMLVRYPGHIPAGSVSDELVVNIDLAPTLLDLAGAAVPEEIQGQSWKPLFDDPDAAFRPGFFYEYFFERKFSATPTLLAFRTKNAKLVKYPGHEEWTELFDLAADPFETQNLVHLPEHRPLLKQMEAAYEAEKKAVGYLVPDYADKPWPEDYIHLKTLRKYHWINQE